VPRASLVVISATLAHFNIPEAGLLLIIGIDQFLDMGRSATNVLGNSIATVAVAKWEGQFAETDQRLEHGAAPTPSLAESRADQSPTTPATVPKCSGRLARAP